jgi:predicted DNA-binding transcriptional regulator YafY
VSDVDRLERLTDLVMVLLHSPRPLALTEIADEVPGYPAGTAARRQAFERDKRLLRDEGIPLITVPVQGPEQFGYRIDPEMYYLPALDLAPDEQGALRIAVAGVHLGNISGEGALLKLGAVGAVGAVGAMGATDPLPAAWLAALDAPVHLQALFEGLHRRAPVSFSYHGRQRELAPGGLWFRRGRWYLVGWDHHAGAARTFRVDRIDGQVTLGRPGTVALPSDFDPSADVPDAPWQVGEGDEQLVTIDLDAVEGPRVAHEIGPDAVVDRRSDGRVRIELEVTNVPALRTWIMSLLDHAVVVGPPSVRHEILRWLRQIVEGDGARSMPATGPLRSGGLQAGNRSGTAPVASHPGPNDDRASPPARHGDARVRLRRLLALMGWLAQVGEAPLLEIERRFDMSRDEVVNELELAACCGLPPYTPDTLMEIVVTEDRVKALLPKELAQARRLAPAEGVAVLAAARAILAVPGSDPRGALGRAVEKLEAVLGQHPVTVHLDEPLHLAEVRDALVRQCRLNIEYYSASSDRVARRTVVPVHLSAIEGHWYLDGYDEELGQGRRFRVDRIGSLEVDASPAPPVPARVREELLGAAGTAFLPGPEAETLRLRLSPEGWWLLDAVPLEGAAELPDGGWEVSLTVSGRAWFERLLLQLGPHVQVVEPATPDLATAGVEAARRILERYGSPDGQAAGGAEHRPR